MEWIRRLLGTGPVSDQQRADLLGQWAQMYASGVDPVRTMETLRAGASATVQHCLSPVLSTLRAGGSPAAAWVRAGLLQGWHGDLLEAGFASGRGEWTLRSLADSLEARALRWRQFQGKMLFPLAILVLAGLLSALPPLVADQIGFIGFVGRILLLPVIIVVTILLLVRLLQAAEDSGGARLIVTLPLIGPWLQRRTRADFVAILAQCLKAGIPARQAVELASGAVRPSVLARRYAEVIPLLDAGQPVSEALRNGRVLDAAAFALVDTGEQGGALDEMLERVARREDQAANEYADTMATWIPRLIYMAIAGMMLVSIVGFWGSYSPGV